MSFQPNSAPGAQIDQETVSYVEFTSSVTVSATTEAGATTVVTAASFVASGSAAYLINCYAPRFDIAAVAGATVIVLLFDNGAVQGIILQGSNPAAVTCIYPMGSCQRRLIPTAGAHVYSIRAYQSGGNGVIQAGLGNGSGSIFMPGFIRITMSS